MLDNKKLIKIVKFKIAIIKPKISFFISLATDDLSEKLSWLRKLQRLMSEDKNTY